MLKTWSSGDALTIRVFGKEAEVSVFSLGDSRFDENEDCREDGFPNASITALKGKASWQSGAKDTTKVTPHNKPHIRDLLGGRNLGGQLPLIG